MFKITKNQNLILDNYLLLHIFDYLHPKDLYNLILSCKIFNNILLNRINNIKVIIVFHNYCLEITKHLRNSKYIYKTYIIDSYVKTRFYYHTFHLNRFPNNDILLKIKEKLKQLNKEYKLKKKFKVKYWNTLYNLNILCLKKNFELL